MTPHQHGKPPGAGKSSFDLIDPGKFLAALDLQRGQSILDMGCGQGLYTLAAAKAVGPDGVVYAVDLWGAGIADLQEQSVTLGYQNIKAMVGDISGRLPLDDGSLDVCLMATVLHDLAEVGQAAGGLKEAARLLKTGGRLAIVEFFKVTGPPGPPLHIRLSAEEVREMVIPYDFQPEREVPVGPYNYLITFRKT